MLDSDKITKLTAPTPDEEVHFLPKQLVGENSNAPKALCVPYITRQFVEDRLDDAVGPLNWQTDIKEQAGVLCFGIAIRNDDGDWVWKWDTGAGGQDDAANESITGGIKRVGRLWGIGRDVSRLASKWRKCRIKDRRGRKVFDSWESGPTLAELQQYTSWVRVQGKEAAGNGAGSRAATDEPDRSNSQPSGVTVDDQTRVGSDPPSQFWHLAKKLMDRGIITEDDASFIVTQHLDGSGQTDFVGAKAELDGYVPETGLG